MSDQVEILNPQIHPHPFIQRQKPLLHYFWKEQVGRERGFK